jgi:hypothetical protein
MPVDVSVTARLLRVGADEADYVGSDPAPLRPSDRLTDVETKRRKERFREEMESTRSHRRAYAPEVHEGN